MAEYEKRVRQLLTDCGRVFVRHGKRDHDIWFSPATQRHVTVDSKIKSRHTANEILKQSGINAAGLVTAIIASTIYAGHRDPAQILRAV